MSARPNIEFRSLPANLMSGGEGARDAAPIGALPQMRCSNGVPGTPYITAAVPALRDLGSVGLAGVTVGLLGRLRSRGLKVNRDSKRGVKVRSYCRGENPGHGGTAPTAEVPAMRSRGPQLLSITSPVPHAGVKAQRDCALLPVALGRPIPWPQECGIAASGPFARGRLSILPGRIGPHPFNGVRPQHWGLWTFLNKVRITLLEGRGMGEDCVPHAGEVGITMGRRGPAPTKRKRFDLLVSEPKYKAETRSSQRVEGPQPLPLPR